MKAMVLAAGLGKRMRPLTDKVPKPLLAVQGKPLIDYHLEALKCAGINHLVINTAYLGEKIENHLGDGCSYGLYIDYSREPEPLDTAAGILRALPLLGENPFLLVSADIWTDFDFAKLRQRELQQGSGSDVTLGHLVLVPNPDHNMGDFGLDNGRVVATAEHNSLTYSGVALLSPSLLANYPNKREKFPLREVFAWAIAEGCLSGEVHTGSWVDVGTPERLAELEKSI